MNDNRAASVRANMECDFEASLYRENEFLHFIYARPNNPRQQAEPALSRSLSQLIAARSRRECRSFDER